MPIQGAVARIIGADAIVINRGSAHGVSEGMTFVVFVELDEVIDPEDGSSLGRLEAVKARVTATHVQERMSVCAPAASPGLASDDARHHTLSSEMIAVSLTQGGLSKAKIDVDRQAISGVPQVGPVTIGDKVRSVQ